MIQKIFAYNIGSLISGTTQVGDIAISEADVEYSANFGGLEWWGGPDEELGYVIAYPVPAGGHPTPISGLTSYIGFLGTKNMTNPFFESTFLDLVNTKFSQNFTTGNQASIWLTDNGYWNSWVLVTPTPTPTNNETQTPTVTATATPTPEPTTTPTNTPTPEPTTTPTNTETPTPTITPTNTPTPEPTTTPTNTPTPEPTTTPTNTETPTETPTNTPTPEPTTTPTNTETPTPTTTPTNTETPTPTPTNTVSGWFFYGSEGIVLGPPSSNGNTVFIISGGTSTYNPNYTGTSMTLFFNNNDNAGASYATQFQGLDTTGGTITMTQGVNVVTYSGTAAQFVYNGTYTSLEVSSLSQMIQSASTSFVSGSSINLTFNTLPSVTPTPTPTTTPAICTSVATQNVAGTDELTGFFFGGFPSPLGVVQVGWYANGFGVTDALVNSIDSINQTITIDAGNGLFVSGQFYTFCNLPQYPNTTPTQTPTNTKTPTPEPTTTPTNTPTPEPTTTPTNTETPTPTVTNTQTPTNTLTPTPTNPSLLQILNQTTGSRTVTSFTLDGTPQPLSSGSYPVTAGNNGYALTHGTSSTPNGVIFNFGGSGTFDLYSYLNGNLVNYLPAYNNNSYTMGGIFLQTSDQVLLQITDAGDLPTPTPSPTTTITPTNTTTVTNTTTPTNTPTNTTTPSNTPTLTPTPSTTPIPVTGYSFNLVVLPYEYPSSGNTIMVDQSTPGIGTTNPNVFATTNNAIYFNAIDTNGVNRSNYFVSFTGQSVTITMSQTGSTAIYSGDSNSFQSWVSGGTISGFTFGYGVAQPGYSAGTTTLIQSAPTPWVTGQTVTISAVVNVGVTPTPTATSVTPTPTPTSGGTGGWFFYSPNNQPVLAPPNISGNTAFIDTATGFGTYNPNYTGGTFNLYFNNITSDGISYASQFSTLDTSGGTITISQGSSTAIYSGSPANYQSVSSYLILTVNNSAQMIQSAATPFVSGSSINVIVS